MLLSLKITIAIGAGMVAALPLALPCGTCDAPLPGEPELVTIAPRAFRISSSGGIHARRAGCRRARYLKRKDNAAHADAAAGYSGRV